MLKERTYGERSLMDKLGVRVGTRVSVQGIRDEAFLDELQRRGADVSLRRRKDSDMVVMSAETTVDLRRLKGVEPYLRRDGAVWVAFPRGRKDLREIDVIGAGLDAGLVDNKVVRFSETHAALRFVIPRARR
jgi:hypothetical protein